MTIPRAFPFGSATAMARALRAGRVGALELLDAMLERVQRHNPALNAIVVFDLERARSDAKAADRARRRGRLLGPLHGLPMTVKESFNLQGLPTTWGSPMLANVRADADALVVQRLKAAGAVVFGKTNVPIQLADFQSYNAVYGTTNNPHDRSRTPGGSSGGSAAAVAAGLTALEYGSDIGGSIRNPAAYCGVYGHKPSWSLVPKRGHQPLPGPALEIDLACVGPLARSAEDLALALKLTMGPDELLAPGWRVKLPPAPKTLRGLKVAAWLDDKLAPVDHEVRQAMEAAATALERAGAKVNRDARPTFNAAAAHDAYQALLVAIMSARGEDRAALLAERATLAESDRSPRAMYVRHATQGVGELMLHQLRREGLRWAWHRFFAEHDLVLAPITVTPAFAHDHSEPPFIRTMTVDGVARPYFEQTFWAGLATASHLPATVAPITRSAAGLPIGAQFIGPEMHDLRTIWAAGELGRLCGGYAPPKEFIA